MRVLTDRRNFQTRTKLPLTSTSGVYVDVLRSRQRCQFQKSWYISLTNLGLIQSLLRILIIASFVVLGWPHSTSAGDKGIRQSVIVEAVAASVNGKPITLRELGLRLKPPRILDLKQASNDSEVQHVLDTLIMEYVIRAEAETRKISVDDDDVERYIEEVARRNGLSMEGFKTAIEQERGSFRRYREDVKNEILRSKLTSLLFQGGVGISNEEISSYLKDHPEISRRGTKIKLGQIFIGLKMHSVDEARALIVDARKQLLDGADFSELARRISEGTEAQEGGSLGLLTESDLNPIIFEAVFSLAEGAISEIVSTDRGMHLFKVEERLVETEEDHETLEKEVRTVLEQQKLENSVQTFFSSELFKRHSVDKKI